MAHLIDQTTGMDAIAFVGDTPWHGLGQRLTPGQSIDVWRKEAGLDYTVCRSPVQFATTQKVALTEMEDRHVLYRNDTGAPLSVVSKDYRVVQPGEVLDFFGKLAEIGGFELETAGALADGKKIWGLAKVHDGAPVIGHDIVRPYVLLATSFDGTLATTAKFTAVRVVCNNTLTMSVGQQTSEGFRGKTEDDTEGLAVSTQVRVPHSTKFNHDDVRRSLGIVADVYDKWLIQTRLLAEQAMNVDQADIFTYRLVNSITNPNDNIDIRKNRVYRRIMDIFTGDMIGGELTGGMNRWRMLNAVTEYSDWERGRTPSTRMQSAWFGSSEGMKNRAYQMLASNESFKFMKAAA